MRQTSSGLRRNESSETKGFLAIMNVPSAEHLKTTIIQSLRKQGYKVQDGIIHLPDNPTKDTFQKKRRLKWGRKKGTLVLRVLKILVAERLEGEARKEREEADNKGRRSGGNGHGR